MKYDSAAKRSIRTGHLVGLVIGIFTAVGLTAALGFTMTNLTIGLGIGVVVYLLSLSVGWVIGALINGSHD
ncbi:MAG TPA: hypothetical protein VGN60_13585 [Devosia sp.]|jgi:hypothetical protein|nr:hypothetical protein [Devosia sp.]